MIDTTSGHGVVSYARFRAAGKVGCAIGIGIVVFANLMTIVISRRARFADANDSAGWPWAFWQWDGFRAIASVDLLALVADIVVMLGAGWLGFKLGQLSQGALFGDRGGQEPRP